MPSRKRLYQSQCEGKQQHNSLGKGWAHIRSLEKDGKDVSRMEPYYCFWCKKVRFTSDTESKRGIRQIDKPPMSAKRPGFAKPGPFCYTGAGYSKFSSRGLESVSGLYRVVFKMRSGLQSSRTFEAGSTEEAIELFNGRHTMDGCEIQSVWKRVAQKSEALEIVE